MIHPLQSVARTNGLPVDEFVEFAKGTKFVDDDGYVSTWWVNDLIAAFKEFQDLNDE